MKKTILFFIVLSLFIVGCPKKEKTVQEKAKDYTLEMKKKIEKVDKDAEKRIKNMSKEVGDNVDDLTKHE